MMANPAVFTPAQIWRPIVSPRFTRPTYGYLPSERKTTWLSEPSASRFFQSIARPVAEASRETTAVVQAAAGGAAGARTRDARANTASDRG